jgi:hypothetical protein
MSQSRGPVQRRARCSQIRSCPAPRVSIGRNTIQPLGQVQVKRMTQSIRLSAMKVSLSGQPVADVTSGIFASRPLVGRSPRLAFLDSSRIKVLSKDCDGLAFPQNIYQAATHLSAYDGYLDPAGILTVAPRSSSKIIPSVSSLRACQEPPFSTRVQSDVRSGKS